LQDGQINLELVRRLAHHGALDVDLFILVNIATDVDSDGLVRDQRCFESNAQDLAGASEHAFVELELDIEVCEEVELAKNVTLLTWLRGLDKHSNVAACFVGLPLKLPIGVFL